jgi:energy-coupling factor transporter ATP-binding protein EcfA2
MLNELIDEFKDKIDINDYYSYLNFEIVKEELLSNKNNIIFLLGPPGSGKSFMLNYLYFKYPDRYFLYPEPTISKNDLLKDYGNKTILVDEAQLLDSEVLEHFRILSDKGNPVIFSMHLKEGEKIANLPQFRSRYTQKIYMKELTYQDFENFVLSKFIKHNKTSLINKKMLKKIFKITKGNFRLSKKFIFTALNLLEFSFNNGLKYKQIDNCIFEMSAIELGLR